MSTSQYYGWLWTETSAVKKKITKQKKRKRKITQSLRHNKVGFLYVGSTHERMN